MQFVSKEEVKTFIQSLEQRNNCIMEKGKSRIKQDIDLSSSRVFYDKDKIPYVIQGSELHSKKGEKQPSIIIKHMKKFPAYKLNVMTEWSRRKTTTKLREEYGTGTEVREEFEVEIVNKDILVDACEDGIVDSDGDGGDCDTAGDINESTASMKKEIERLKEELENEKRKNIELTSAFSEISEYNKELVKKYQKEMKLRKQYHNELVELKGNIRVFCRVRPAIKEDGQGQQSETIVSLDKDDDGILNVNSKGRMQTFEVDKVFGQDSSQIMVFEEMKSLVTSCIDGYNVCIFAYGQTGSGKTYTMEGTSSNPGINQRAFKELFTETSSRTDWKFTITLSALEIYNEMIRDLLSENEKLEVRMNAEGNFHVPGLAVVVVECTDAAQEWFKIGQQNRATAATKMNEHSSRSHALLCISVIGQNITTGAKTTGKLNLVDLAGSENVSKSGADGERLKEAQSINKSLSALGDVIFALRSKQSHVPYRNSKLTYLLQDSLGGDSKTLMIAQIAPVRKNEGETMSTMFFSQRCKNINLGRGMELCSPARGYSTPKQKLIKSSKLLNSPSK